MARAAGLLILDPVGRLLVMRRAKGDFAGHWGLPAGHVEDGESDLQAAVRETFEETGSREFAVDDTAEFRRGDFVAYGATSEGFEPALNDEHDAALWAMPSDLPAPLHPTIRPMLEELQRHFGYVEPTVDSAADAPKVKAGREVHVHLHGRK